MKIIVFIGSLRKDSFNRKVFEEYRSLASGMEFVEGKYDDFPLFSEDLERSNFPEAVKNVAEHIQNSDAVMFFSPEYNSTIPGALKNALDWLSRLKDQPFAKKPTALLGASPGKLGTARMQYDFRKVGVAFDMNMMNKPEVMISEVNKIFDESGKMTDEKTKSFLAKHIESFKKHITNNS